MKSRFIFLCLAIFGFSVPAFAEKKIRFDFGAFNGRIARTSGGSTVPLNTAMSNVGTGEFQLGNKKWKFLLGGSFNSYRAKVYGSTEFTDFSYGDTKAGVVYSTSCCEWKLLYVAARTPYTNQPDPVTLDPVIVSANYAMLENILSAKVPAFRLMFAYYLKYLVSAPELTGGGQLINNYFIGGCVRVFFMFKQRVGPSICVDLQELYLPNSTVVTRQEVSGRFAIDW
jgi:hypothetical protein